MKFKLYVVNPSNGDRATFYYDNETSELTSKDGKPLGPRISTERRPKINAVSASNPGRKTSPRLLKISLGLSCNYECEYCSQRFVQRADETNPLDVQKFMDSLDSWVTHSPEKIEFWGGEPFVYIKTMKPLAEALRLKYPGASFSVITNGSLLSFELNEWLDVMGFSVSVSHDGPGQHVRGPDPLADQSKREAILDLYKRLAPKRRMSFNAMLNRENISRAKIVKFFADLTGDSKVPVGEGALVDAYDDGGKGSSLRPEEFGMYRNLAFHELRTGQVENFGVISQKVVSFVNSIRTGRSAESLGQKCGMDREDAIAVDLRGNVVTCQNVSAASVAPNGNSHNIGHVSKLEEVALTTATHWAHRDECPKCPMLQICHGACMFLEGDLWETTCDNAYSDAVPIFAAAIEFLTGYVPIKILGPHREDRHDLWKPTATSARKVIPIKIAA